MLVVSNTSPVSNLAFIGQLALLRDQFGTIIIPDVVEEELGRLSHPSAGREIVRAMSEGWLIPMDVPAQAPHPARVAKARRRGERCDPSGIGVERESSAHR